MGASAVGHIAARAALKSVPPSIREAALGVGASKMQTVFHHVLPLAMTLYTLFAIYTINMLFGYLFETRSRAHMDSLFGQYVPPDLVKEMSRDPENYSLASQKRELSVLFTDIRSFTTISEGLEADELSELMGEYLTPMTRIVHDTGGTIDKYIGDAVMAFWGAPIPHPHHAEQAVGPSAESDLHHCGCALGDHNLALRLAREIDHRKLRFLSPADLWIIRLLRSDHDPHRTEKRQNKQC